MQLTTTNIRSAKPGDILRDDKVKGLHLRVFKGRKSFMLYYRTKAGRERRPKLGDFPSITVLQARDAASAILRIVAEGKDPAAELAAARTRPTMKDLWKEYRDQHVLKRKKTDTDDKGAWNNHILPRLGKKTPVDEISYLQVEKMHNAITDAGHPYMANRVVASLSKAMNLAERWGWRPINSNPCGLIERNPETKRRRKLSLEETVEVFKALDAAMATDKVRASFIYLLIFTGARAGEIRNAKRTAIHGAKLKIPVTEHKTGRYVGDKEIELPTQALEIIRGLPVREKSDYLFPATREGKSKVMQHPGKFWRQIREAAKVPDLRIHDLRRSFASYALSADKLAGGAPIGLSQVGDLMGHINEQTTKGYAYLLDEARANAAQQTADVFELVGRTG